MKIPFNKKFTLIEREDFANYHFVTAAWEGFTHMMEGWGFKSGEFLSAEYINTACNLFALKENFDELNEKHFQMLFSNPKAWDNLHKITLESSRKMLAFSAKAKRLDPKKLSDEELVKIVDNFNELQKAIHVPRGPMWMLETPVNILSDYLLGYLEEQAEDRKVKTKINEALQILSASVSKNILAVARGELIKIALIKNKKARDKRLAAYAKKYEWLEYGLQGKILDEAYFKGELKKIISRNPEKAKRDFFKEFEDLKSKQARIIKEYGIGKTHKKIFKIVGDSTFTRLQSKYSQFYGYYAMENIFREIGSRSGLTLAQVRYLAPEDFKRVLIEKKDYCQITNERMKHSVHIANKGKTVFYYGKQADKIMKKIKFFQEERKAENAEVITGQPAYNGYAKGRVKIINIISELVKIHAGNILVSHMTNPDIVPAMKVAAAIITDLGGITCHAAIVSRELKKPCVIGTKVATQVLKDGDYVEVDANKGVVRKIN